MKTKFAFASLFTTWLVSTLLFGGIHPLFLKIHLFFAPAILFYLLISKNFHSKITNFELIAFIGVSCTHLVQMVNFSPRVLQFLSKSSYERTFGILQKLQISNDPLFSISIDRNGTLLSLLYFLIFCCIYLSAKSIFTEKVYKKLFIYFFVSSTFLLSLFSIIQYLSKTKKIYWIFDKGFTFYGTYLNQNHAGALFAISFGMTLGLLPRIKKTNYQYFLSTLLFVFLLSVLFSSSRSSFLLIIITSFLFFSKHLYFFKRQRNLFLIPILISSFFGIFFYIKFPVFQRILESLSLSSSSEFYRFKTWSIAISLFCKSIIFGMGYSNFKLYSPSYFIENDIWHLPEFVENDYLGILSGFGLLTFLSLAPIFYRSIQNAFQSIRKPQSSYINYSLFLGLLSFFISSIFIFHIPVTSHHYLFAFLFSAISIEPINSLYRYKILQKYFPIFLLTFLSLIIIFSYHSDKKSFLNSMQKDVDFLSNVENTKSNHKYINLQKESIRDELVKSLTKDPFQEEGIFLFGKLHFYPNDTLESYKILKSYFPFSLKKRYQLLKIIGLSNQPLLAADEIKSLIRSNGAHNKHLKKTMLVDLIIFQILGKESHQEIQSSIDRLQIDFPDSWEHPIFSTYFMQNESNLILDSWIKFPYKFKDPTIWENSLLYFWSITNKKHEYKKIIQALSTVRPDLGEFLRRVQKRTSSKLSWSIPLKKVLLLNSHSRHNIVFDEHSFTLSGKTSPLVETGFYYQTFFRPKPESISVSLTLKGQQMPLGKVLLVGKDQQWTSASDPIQIGPNLWEIQFLNIGSQLPDSVTKIIGIGYIAGSQKATYFIENIEVFVNTRFSD